MTLPYATRGELIARISPTYAALVPADATELLAKASELIQHVTRGQSDGTADATIATARDAACDQVEYWLETGEEHDVLGLVGGAQNSRVNIANIPPALGQRARRTLLRGGLLWAGVPSR